MRPIKLTIKNFLSYGDEEQIIDLDINSIISFTGNNGHGKSALLEAITWALWGQARRGQGVSKSDDMVMHIGSSLMFVTLEIKVKNDIYKIHRTCEKKSNRIFTNLELYSINEIEEINLSSSHQKDTQLLIEKIIGISYEMFINTVYLKQGSSNEFSKKTAKERKDILCSILKIDQIEEIRQKIINDVKQIMQDRTVLLKLEERLLDNKKEQQLNLHKENLNIITKEINEIGELLKIEKADNDEIEKEYLLKKNEYNEKNKIIDNCQKNIQYFYTTYTIENIPYQQYKKTITEIKKISTAMQNKINISEVQIKLLEIEKQHKEIQNKYDEETKINQERLKTELEISHENIIIFLENSDECKVFQLKQELYFNEKMINNYDKMYKDNICSICDNKIIKKNIIDNYKKKLLLKKEKIEKDLIIFTLEKNATLNNFELIKKNIIEKYSHIQKKIDIEFHEKIKRIILEKNIEKQKETEYNKISINQEKKKFLEEEISSFKINEITAKIKKTIYAIYDNKNKIQELTFTTKNEKIILEKKELEIKEKRIILEQKNKEFIELEKKSHEIKNYISLLENQISEEQKELQELQEKIKITESNLKIKSNLAHILSKNNLQAALIEEAIPIIEEEANNILQKLTNGTSKIYIESIKDLKSGQIKETLDIKIADHIGIRYYEFFSGGESFRIDLALRIALVKLLAQKSGHYIKTFIIDEGFGSQDSNSLEIMINTLYMLQNEFDLIIIISHLNDMKEQFPIQFHIEKTIKGSTIKQL